MKAEYIRFNESVKAFNLNSQDSLKVVSIAIAMGLSELLPLPSSPVDNPSSFFSFTHGPHLNPVISEWNENVVIDPKLVQETVRQLWTVRYYAAYPKERPAMPINGSMSLCSMMFATSFFITPEVESLLSSNAESIYMLSRKVTEVSGNPFKE